MILEKKKGSVRSLDVAEQMNVKKPSVSNAIKLLKEGGFLTMDGDKLSWDGRSQRRSMKGTAY